MCYRLCFVTCGVYLYISILCKGIHVCGFEAILLGCKWVFGCDYDRSQKWIGIDRGNSLP